MELNKVLTTQNHKFSKTWVNWNIVMFCLHYYTKKTITKTLWNIDTYIELCNVKFKKLCYLNLSSIYFIHSKLAFNIKKWFNLLYVIIPIYKGLFCDYTSLQGFIDFVQMWRFALTKTNNSNNWILRRLGIRIFGKCSCKWFSRNIFNVNS